MYLDEYARAWQGPYDFTLASITMYAPNRFGVYQLIYAGDSGDQVAYIGVATGDTIRGRLRKHVTGAGNWALAQLGDPSKFRFVYYECDALSAQQIESHVITTAKPPFNTRPEYRNFIPSISVH
jgi:excinuclease UvrABC nuclease subunit